MSPRKPIGLAIALVLYAGQFLLPVLERAGDTVRAMQTTPTLIGPNAQIEFTYPDADIGTVNRFELCVNDLCRSIGVPTGSATGAPAGSQIYRVAFPAWAVRVGQLLDAGPHLLTLRTCDATRCGAESTATAFAVTTPQPTPIGPPPPSAPAMVNP